MNWIFQGNPDQFDIDTYLQDFDTVNWTVRQKYYAPEMGAGDRVFFWRAAGKGKVTPGIVAVGEIIEDPRVFAEDVSALKYWKVSGNEGPELRVTIRISHRLPAGTIFPKANIAADPKLSGLKVLRLANQTNYKLSEVEGNALLEGFLGSSKQSISQPISSHSWTIENPSTAVKILDKSAFLHHGTGIPIEIRSFFISGQMVPGENRQITLSYMGQKYNAHMEMDNQPTPRTRLFWNSDFASLLKESFPHHYKQYSNDQTPEGQVILRLKRLSGFVSYEVSFAGGISKKAVEKDILSEEYEEKGPQKEGGVKEYFGKRYERSPINRQQAIKVHGLSCNACGFNFGKVYGARGADYIEVHHIKPIHTYEIEQHVDPKTDLITVCSNCHRMIHRDPINILSIDDIKKLMTEFIGAASE